MIGGGVSRGSSCGGPTGGPSYFGLPSGRSRSDGFVPGFGVVPAKFDPVTKTVSCQMTQKLREKRHTVIVSAKDKAGKKMETRWSFNFDPAAARPATPEKPATPPAPSAPAAPSAPGPAPLTKPAPAKARV